MRASGDMGKGARWEFCMSSAVEEVGSGGGPVHVPHRL